MRIYLDSFYGTETKVVILFGSLASVFVIFKGMDGVMDIKLYKTIFNFVFNFKGPSSHPGEGVIGSDA